MLSLLHRLELRVWVGHICQLILKQNKDFAPKKNINDIDNDVYDKQFW